MHYFVPNKDWMTQAYNLLKQLELQSYLVRYHTMTAKDNLVAKNNEWVEV